MFCKPVQFEEFLTHHGFIDEIYKAMGSPDLADTAMTVWNILKKTNNIPPLLKEAKSETKSTTFRNEGNKAFSSKRYQKALICYNQALLFAPNSSRAMKLAYSNRSALLLKVKAFSACMKDIDTCFSLGCPLDIVEKLRKRKEEVRNLIWMEKLAEGARSTAFSDEYFQFNVKRNPQIPCASTDVGVILEKQIPSVVATTDVKVGAVLAIEEAFSSLNDLANNMFSCYYCHKMNLNLKPCDGCCVALFCDDECKEICLREYHSIECRIVEMLAALATGTTSRLAAITLLKMKYMSQSWKEIIQASQHTGIKRLKISSINEIFDTRHKFSLLNIKDEKHFFHGPLYNASFITAVIVHYLDTITGFFPQSESDRYGAQKATARILMFLTLYANHTQIINSMTVDVQEKTEFNNNANVAWFSFIGKLKHACNPNVLTVSLNKKIALVAMRPIKKGDELTISYVDHWLDNCCETEVRHRNMFALTGTVCHCIICTGMHTPLDTGTLTDLQRKHYKKLNTEEMRARFHPRNIPDMFSKLCKTMAFLSDVPFSEEYQDVYKLFRRCLLYLQDLVTENIMLDYV